MKRISLALISILIFVAAASAQTKSLTELQQNFVNLKFGMFIHFNMPTFNDADWPDPDASPTLFNPKKLNPTQWAKGRKICQYELWLPNHQTS
jgi:alpha-L-fucosidase